MLSVNFHKRVTTSIIPSFNPLKICKDFKFCTFFLGKQEGHAPTKIYWKKTTETRKKRRKRKRGERKENKGRKK